MGKGQDLPCCLDKILLECVLSSKLDHQCYIYYGYLSLPDSYK